MSATHTSKTRTIRERYGISQQEMADFLGISRTHLGMYEQRRRDLPADANLKATEMILHHLTRPADLQAVLESEHDEHWKLSYAKAIKKAIYQKKKKLLKAEKELLAMQKQFSQAVHFAHYINNQQHTAALSEGDKLWHAEHEGIATQYTKTHAAPMQLLAQLEVENLQHFIDKANMLLQQVESKQPA